MPKFRKKPLVIEATRLTRPVLVETLEGYMSGKPGDWLITGVRGEQYVCRDDVFRETYEPCDEEAERLLGEERAAVVALDGVSVSDDAQLHWFLSQTPGLVAAIRSVVALVRALDPSAQFRLSWYEDVEILDGHPVFEIASPTVDAFEPAFVEALNAVSPRYVAVLVNPLDRSS